jgi:hypothetical protein
LKFSRKALADTTSTQAPLTVALMGLCVAAASLTAWQARAALPRWMQDAVGSSAIEAALYRAMEIPGVKALYPRPPKEAQGELNGLIAKASEQADLYSLRAIEEEQALDFPAAEADWKTYASRSKDTINAKLELADYYHRRGQASDEVATLMEIGSTPALPSEQYNGPAEQRSWKAFERLISLAADQGLDEDVFSRAYAAWIARYPKQPSLYAREFRWLSNSRLNQGKDAAHYNRADALVGQYRKAFPEDTVFPLKATALLEYRRGSIDKALATYDAGFQPLWPTELVESYYALLAQTHRQRKLLADARAHLAQNPDDLNAMARLFYYSQQQGNLPAAQQVVEAYRLSKENRKAAWSAQQLYTLASLTEAIQAYPEAARYNFALYHAQGALASGASPQAEGLSGVVRILLNAPDQPVELGANNLSMYRDIATLDQGPGYWNGILSLWMNSQSPEQSYHEEEQRAQPYFHRAKAAELLATLDKNFPAAAQRAELHQELIRVFADYGESALVIKAGNDFLTNFSSPSEENNRVAVAMYIADAYARQQDTKDEFALYDRMLTELGGMTAGMPLTGAEASNRGPAGVPAETSQTDQSSDTADAAAAAQKAEKSRAFEVGASQPMGVFVAGSQEYQRLLERYLGRLTATGQLPQALAVLRRELDRNPNDPLLYERLASFLEQNNLSAQQEEVYNQAVRKFQDKSWYDKLARLYLREKKREAFADLTKQVTGIFHGTELESYFNVVTNGGDQMYLELNLYAHQRFPHDVVFIRNLLSAYQAKATRDQAAWEKLLREHWSDSEQLRQEFFDYLNSHGKLDAELAQLKMLVPDPRAQNANPDATREMAEIELWRSHFETSAPLLDSLAEAYPADEELGTQASSVFRSLAYYDVSQIEHAVAIEKHLLVANPADMDRLARIGDIYSDSGADSTTGHQNIAAAAPYWRRMTGVHPGTPDGYLQAATIFWDYYQFDEALTEIREARTKFNQPALYGYEAGAIDEGKRDFPSAIREYIAAAVATDGGANSSAASRLLQLARRKATAKAVDTETAKAVEANSGIAALQLRERVLEAQKRSAEIGPLLEAALAKASSFEQAQAIAAEAQSHTLVKLYEVALQREVALANDPVQKLELSYELAKSFAGRKDLDDAARLIDQVYRENPKLLGVVRATADFYWNNKQSTKAIDTLLEASKAAQTAQPALSRQLLVEAADKANDSGSYAQARALVTPLIDPAKAGVTVDDAYNAPYLAIVADSYARAGDDAGLKQFYLDKLNAIRSASIAVDERKQKTVLLRRGLIPALTRMKDYAGAVDQYIAILSAYPEDASSTQEASLYALRYGRQRQVVDFVSSTVKASPRDSRFAIMLAQIDTTFEDYPAAIDAYAHAIVIRSDRADVYAAKADLEERLQRLDDACKEYERLYVLSYRNPDWMLKVSAVRARQGRSEDAVKALERAWIEGHPATAQDYFRVATQLESWKMLEESLRFAELGVKAEGGALLAGSEPGDRNADDAEGVVIYARLLTRTRQVQKALTVLDAAREEAEKSPNSPGIVVEQVEKQGLASVTNAEWRKHRIEELKLTAAGRYRSAMQEMGKTVATYFTPEEKQQFASLVDARAKRPSEELLWIDVASHAGLAEEEAHLRKQVLLNEANLSKSEIEAQYRSYLQMERSRMAYSELAETIEAYIQRRNLHDPTSALNDEAQAYRSAGDEAAELRVLNKIDFDREAAVADRERYLQLLLKHDAIRFESIGASSDKEQFAFAAPNYTLAHSDLKIARAALGTHAKPFPGPWKNAYSALLGLYYRDRSPVTETAFHSILGDGQTIGERIRSHATSSEDHESASPQLAGGIWFYYGMRYGVYRTLAPEKNWPQSDPEDFLAAGLERNTSVGSYVGLARAYADAGKTAAALLEYRHALELVPDSPAIHDAMAQLLWKSGKKDEAIAKWRSGLAALNRIQNKGAAPESFWGGFALIAQHLGSRNLTSQLHAEMDTLLRNYLQRNGNYRSEELLKAAFKASASSSEGVEWVLSLSSAASDPASVLPDVDNAAWLPAEAHEAILLREIELARIAASHAEGDNDYLAQRPAQLETTLLLYYVAQKQDAKAEEILNGLNEKEREQGELFTGRIELAARGHRLDTLLAAYRLETGPETYPTRLQQLREAAGTLAKEGNKADALTIWEFVFERGQLNHDLMVSDFMGLAEARLAAGNLAGALEMLRRMTLQHTSADADSEAANDGMANYDHAAALLVEKNHSSEAIEFLTVLARGVPWNGSYRLRLAQAQIQADQKKSAALAALATLAADNRQSYSFRTEAAFAMQDGFDKSTDLGSGELQVIAGGKVTSQQAQRPYFVAARMVASDFIADASERATLLRQAIAISPAGVAGAADLSEDDLRLRLLRAEATAGHDATALGLIEPLISRANTYSGGPDETAGSEADEAANDSADSAAADDAEMDVTAVPSPGNETLATLESKAPLPVRGAQSDAEKLVLAALIAQVYEHTGDAASALPYLKLAAYLQKDPAPHAELRRHIDQVNIALALEAQNALRRPTIQKALNQSGVVRARLTAAQLAQQQEAQ